MNGLMNGYAGCMDDAADQIDVAQEKQLDIHDALKVMLDKGKEFLDILNKLDQNGAYLDTYRDTLEDAIEGTKDALSDAADAGKTMPSAPVHKGENHHRNNPEHARRSGRRRPFSPHVHASRLSGQAPIFRR